VQQVDLLLSGGYVITQQRPGEVLANAAVAVQADRIVDIGPAAEVALRVTSARTIDCRGRAVLPGLIDCHVHTCQSTARGLADDVPVAVWLNKILPFEAALEAEDVAASVRLACIEMIKSGTTGVMEGCAPPEHVDVVGQVFADSGLRCVLTRSTMEHADPTWNPPPSFLADPETNLRQTRRMIERWHGAAAGRLSAWAAYRHAPDVSDELIVELARLADELDVGLHAHQSTRRFGEAAHLDALGILSPRMVFAHAIRYTRHELELLKYYGVKIDHNPGASMHGAYGSAVIGQFPEMLDMGITVCLGCDGATNNNTLDMFREMRLAATIHKEVRTNATVLPAAVALQMATTNGAQACRWADVGVLAPGNKADLIVVNLEQPHLLPVHDLISNLVYCANGHDVETTIVDGRVLMMDRQVQVADEQAVLLDAVASAERVLQRLGRRAVLTGS
jgi:5-methylthioadenosine/S-adenosylhomocysteine deaminase